MNKVLLHGQGRGLGSRAGGQEQEKERRTISSSQQGVILVISCNSTVKDFCKGPQPVSCEN